MSMTIRKYLCNNSKQYRWNLSRHIFRHSYVSTKQQRFDQGSQAFQKTKQRDKWTISLYCNYLVGLNPALPSEFQLIFLLGFEIPTALCIGTCFVHLSYKINVSEKVHATFQICFTRVRNKRTPTCVITESSFKGVISKPSGDCIVAPNFCFWGQILQILENTPFTTQVCTF